MSTNENINVLNWSREEILAPNNTKISAFFTKFKNANLIFLTDNDNKIGTIAIAVPIKLNSTSQITTSSVPLIFGVKNELITKAIAEKVANITNKLSIAITNFVSKIEENYKSLFKIIEKILKK
ncbi:MAG: proteasome assembly chaperone 4 family protein [Candidatus Helarchaeota archaeon]